MRFEAPKSPLGRLVLAFAVAMVFLGLAVNTSQGHFAGGPILVIVDVILGVGFFVGVLVALLLERRRR